MQWVNRKMEYGTRSILTQRVGIMLTGHFSSHISLSRTYGPVGWFQKHMDSALFTSGRTICVIAFNGWKQS